VIMSRANITLKTSFGKYLDVVEAIHGFEYES